MPPPCLRCERSIIETCSCYSFRPRPQHQLTSALREGGYDAFRRERANLGKAYDDAVEEEDRLACMWSEARERRLELRRRYEQFSMLASTVLLRSVTSVTEFRDAILQPLLPGEVLAFQTACDLLLDKRQIAADLSPLKLILSGSKQLQSMFREMLLNGLSGLDLSPWSTHRTNSRRWSAVSIRHFRLGIRSRIVDDNCINTYKR